MPHGAAVRLRGSPVFHFYSCFHGCGQSATSGTVERLGPLSFIAHLRRFLFCCGADDKVYERARHASGGKRCDKYHENYTDERSGVKEATSVTGVADDTEHTQRGINTGDQNEDGRAQPRQGLLYLQ